MGAVDSKIGFNFGKFKFNAVKRRKSIPRHTRSRKKSYSRRPSSNSLRTRKIAFDSRSKSKSKSRSRSRSYKKYPRGTWINTAKDYYIKNNILYAKLKNKNGIYINASIDYNKDDILKNYDGKFVLLYIKEYYTTDNFNVYYKSKKIDISPIGFKILGDGYAKNNFDIIYKGEKIDISPIGFELLGDGYAKNNFDIIYKGEKIDISPIGFELLGDGYAKNNFDIIYKGVKMNVLNIHTFKLLENGNAKDIKGYFYKGKRI